MDSVISSTGRGSHGSCNYPGFSHYHQAVVLMDVVPIMGDVPIIRLRILRAYHGVCYYHWGEDILQLSRFQCNSTKYQMFTSQPCSVQYSHLVILYVITRKLWTKATSHIWCFRLMACGQRLHLIIWYFRLMACYVCVSELIINVIMKAGVHYILGKNSHTIEFTAKHSPSVVPTSTLISPAEFLIMDNHDYSMISSTCSPQTRCHCFTVMRPIFPSWPVIDR